MRLLHELINEAEPALPLVQQLAAQVPGRCLVLPPSPDAGEVLVKTQVTTRSPMGAIAYHTGGIMVDGWIRILGSGSERITRNLPDWNQGRSTGFYLIADDVVGGFYAIDGGGLGQSQGTVCYWAPDSLEWMSLNTGYTGFIEWITTKDYQDFYSDLRWPDWESEHSHISGDRCLSFYPFLWTREGSIQSSHRGVVPVSEAFDLKVDLLRQLSADA